MYNLILQSEQLLIFISTIPRPVLSIISALGYAFIGLLTLINIFTRKMAYKNFQGFGAALLIFTTSAVFFSLALDTPEWQAMFMLLNLLVLALVLLWARKFHFIVAGYNAIRNSIRLIEQQERWLKIMHEHVTDGLAVYSPSGELLYINKAGVKLLNLSAETLGQSKGILLHKQAKGPQEIDLLRKALLGEVVRTKIETDAPRGDAAKIIEVTLSPVYGRLGKSVAVVACYRDITEFHKLEKAKVEFMQIASHELRTPLTAVNGYLSLLQMNKYGTLGTKQKNLLERAIQASKRLSVLVDNLILVTSIEESKTKMNFEEIDVNSLVTSITQELAGEADRRGVVLRFLAPQMPIPTVFGDKEKLYHVFSNLVTNAIKYTPEGGHIFVEARHKNNSIEVQVADTGIGIKKPDMERLFKKFERLNGARSTKEGGSGLGLVIVKSFTEMHGGKVTVRSSEGRGTTFTVSLPLNRS